MNSSKKKKKKNPSALSASLTYSVSDAFISYIRFSFMKGFAVISVAKNRLFERFYFITTPPRQIVHMGNYDCSKVFWDTDYFG